MSLADELLADPDFISTRDEEAADDDQSDNNDSEDVLMRDLEDLEEEEHMEENDEPEENKNVNSEVEMKSVKDVKKVAKLLSSRQMRDILTKIEQLKDTNRSQTQIMGPVEEDPEYKLIVQANNLTVDIDNEILVVHKFIRDHYAKKFPELESLVLNPLDYTRAVKAIGNEMLPTSTVIAIGPFPL
ncbi:U4/U6 small nuclear ribonucleoprotein Prp31 [Rhizophagus irregularis DAOM 181602=DAOM 197198]|nr:U4/U6 small nuclear ribonucleoprotein Prp31 [Rhizophagus irregularis DAOM 181602=DAOM 197198]CAB5196658.1 unnamed protein product [Rhizophagus irregularis]